MHSCGHFHDADGRRDPTGTTTIRKRFEADLVRRFKKIRALIIESVGKNDALGLAPTNRLRVRLGDEAIPQNAYAFARSSEKVSLFMQWLQDEEMRGIFELQPGAQIASSADNAWTNVYIERAYRKGVSDAAGRLSSAGANVSDTWVSSFFNRPIHADRLGLIYTRTFTDLKGITDEMDKQISRVLAEGIGLGKGPINIAREMANRVDKIGITRARAIARTEVIRAHSQATLNSYEEARAEGVEVISEFTTSGDNRVCPECQKLEGRTFTISEARGIIPVHVNCFIGETLVLPRAEVLGASKRMYKGKIATIKTHSGISFRCTPNHPVLTNFGWLPAGGLTDMNSLICDSGHEWTEGTDEVERIDSIVGAIHNAIDTPAEAVELTQNDYHGDASNGDYAVIASGYGVQIANRSEWDDEKENILANKIKSGFYGAVHLDRVESVEFHEYSGFVYNIETANNFYAANGVITHNCRCAWAPKILNGTGIELI